MCPAIDDASKVRGELNFFSADRQLPEVAGVRFSGDGTE